MQDAESKVVIEQDKLKFGKTVRGVGSDRKQRKEGEDAMKIETQEVREYVEQSCHWHHVGEFMLDANEFDNIITHMGDDFRDTTSEIRKIDDKIKIIEIAMDPWKNTKKRQEEFEEPDDGPDAREEAEETRAHRFGASGDAADRRTAQMHKSEDVAQMIFRQSLISSVLSSLEGRTATPRAWGGRMRRRPICPAR